MKKILLFIILSNTCASQPFVKYWDKCFGGTMTDNFANIAASNHNIIFSGNSRSPVSGNKTATNCPTTIVNYDLWLTKTDSGGNILWDNCYGGSGGEAGGFIIVLPNGNILVSAITNSDSSCDKAENGRGLQDCWIFMTDSNGILLWEKTYGGNDFDGAEEPPVCAVTNSGNIVLANSSRSPVSGDKTDSVWNFSYDYWILYLDSAGNKLWDRSYGGLGEDNVRTVCSTADGNILVGGLAQNMVGGDITDSARGGTNDYWVIKLDNAGNKIWDRLYGGSGDENLRAMQPTNDGGAIICGFTYSPLSGDVSEPPVGNNDTWIVKIDSSGNKQWDKRYGGSNGVSGTDIYSYQDGYLIAADLASDSANDVTEPSYGFNDFWVMKIDSVGNKRWDKRFGGNKEEEVPKIAVLPDNSIVVSGTSKLGTSAMKTDSGYGTWDYWAVRFKYNDSLVSINETKTTTALTVWPNPASHELNIKSNNTTEKAILTLYDQTGKLVYVNKNTPLNTRINVSSLSKGIYYLQISNATLLETIKVVKL